MNKLLIVSALLALLVSSLSVANTAAVQVTGSAAPSHDATPVTLQPSDLSQLSQTYNEPVRWQQVLGHIYNAGIDPRWSVLTKPAELPELTQLRDSVLQDLHQLGQLWARQGKQDLLRSATALSEQLAQLPLAARQPVTLDYDVVRLDISNNPLLQGEYQLLLQPRPNYVWAQGLVRLPGKRPFVGGGFAYDYGRRLSLLPGADKQQLWIIQPDGEVMSSPINAFEPEFVGIAPGATLYVGFTRLPKAYADLNQRIITLLANREL